MKKLTLFLLGLITSFGVMAQDQRTYGYPNYNQPAPANVRVITSQDQATRSIQDAASRRDNTAPTISISSPATNSSYVAGTNVSIVTAASDNVGVTRVDLKVNNVTKYTKTVAPWSFTWATSGLGAGSYSITATAYDAAGNNKTSTAIIIKLTAAPPVGDTAKPIFISSVYVDGQTRDTVTVYTGVASNIACTVLEETNLSNCTFLVNNTIQSSQPGFALPTITKSYTFAWTPSGVTYKPGGFGYATLTLKATDAAGNYAVVSRVAKVIYTFTDTTHYPASYRLKCPPVINQGGEGSCVTMATVYNAFSINQYYKTGASSYSYSTNIFSPEYAHDIFTTAPNMSGCSFNGSDPVGLLDYILVPRGCCLYSSLPYSSAIIPGCQSTSTYPCPNADSCLVTNTMRAEAANYKAKNYVGLKMRDTAAIKYFLARNHAIIGGVTIPYSWNSPEYLNGPTDSNYVLTLYNKGSAGGSGHAITIVGWDDVRQAFLIVNSWGPQWGFGGYAWIGYDLFYSSNSDIYYRDAYIIDPFEY